MEKIDLQKAREDETGNCVIAISAMNVILN